MSRRYKTVYENLVRDYERLRADLISENNPKTVLKLQGRFTVEGSDFFRDMSMAYQFVFEAFSGKYRKDGKTPLVAHSAFLPFMLWVFEETNYRGFFTALFHDLLEDTEVSVEELRRFVSRLETADKRVVDFVQLLTENKALSSKEDNGSLSPRTVDLVTRIKDSETPVIDTKIVDGLHDLMDLSFLGGLNEEERMKGIKRKVVKRGSILMAITENRKDYLQLAAEVHRWKLNDLEEELGYKIQLVEIH